MRTLVVIPLLLACSSAPAPAPQPPQERGILIVPGTERVVIHKTSVTSAGAPSVRVDFLDHGTTIDSKDVRVPGCVRITERTDHIVIASEHWGISHGGTDEECAHFEMLHNIDTSSGD